MKYAYFLRRHMQLLDDASILEVKLRHTQGHEQQKLERELTRVAREGEAVFDAMLSILEQRNIMRDRPEDSAATNGESTEANLGKRL